MKVILKIRANEGYSPEQVGEEHNLTTVGELKEWLEGYDDDAEIVTDNVNNRYGANYGRIVDCYEHYDDEKEDE